MQKIQRRRRDPDTPESAVRRTLIFVASSDFRGEKDVKNILNFTMKDKEPEKKLALTMLAASMVVNEKGMMRGEERFTLDSWGKKKKLMKLIRRSRDQLKQ